MQQSGGRRLKRAINIKISTIRFLMNSPTSGLKLRTVPPRVAVLGITLNALPACRKPLESRAVSEAQISRDMMVCSARQIWAATFMGSIPFCGVAPWAPLPMIVILNRSTAELTGPDAQKYCPA